MIISRWWSGGERLCIFLHILKNFDHYLGKAVLILNEVIFFYPDNRNVSYRKWQLEKSRRRHELDSIRAKMVCNEKNIKTLFLERPHAEKEMISTLTNFCCVCVCFVNKHPLNIVVQSLNRARSTCWSWMSMVCFSRFKFSPGLIMKFF